MFIAYLKYKKSWILLIGLLLLLTNALIQLDAGIRVEPHSLIYLNSLFLIIFVGFLIWRYKKETAYYKSLLALSNPIEEDWFQDIPNLITIFQIVSYTRYCKTFINIIKASVVRNSPTSSWNIRILPHGFMR
ncbi:hypothetical protein [Paenibacillus sp. DCT19]|uniref:hypothetical protein n=1 Tax=Paenibacillus sp. DCT19 TaxID=2211212 RepID=UPI001C2C110F|nr:hypothetical protein [Paenibacillus sp. DCT19]